MRNSIKCSFEELGVDYDECILDKCVEICIRNGVTDSEEFVDMWMAYSVSHLKGAAPNEKNLVRFERDSLSKQSRRPLSTDVESDIISPSSKVGFSTPPDKVTLRKNRVSPQRGFSPASFSPNINTPSSRYKDRSNSGTVVCEKPGNDFPLDDGPITIRPYCESELLLNPLPLYMSFHLTDYFEAENKHLRKVSETLSERFNLNEIVPVRTKHPTSVVTVGRIVCDADGRLNAESVLLEGDADESNGEVVKLDIAGLSQYSVFPGQVVAVEGLNISGEKLVVSKIWTDASLLAKPASLSLPNGGFKVIVACGPFTPSDSLSYQPLMDLMTVVEEEEPHCLLLLGPFIDAEHAAIKDGLVAETFDEYFKRLLRKILDPLKNKRTEVAVVSSWRDCHGAVVFPTPPYSVPDLDKIHFFSDPAWIELAGGIVIAATSNDVLMHIGKEEISRPAGGDRLARLCEHILQQRSFYPLRPPGGETPLDPTLQHHLEFYCNPHILLLPSDLRYFIKDINGVTVVNPEHLAKGLVGGSYAKIMISSDGNVCGKILKV